MIDSDMSAEGADAQVADSTGKRDNHRTEDIGVPQMDTDFDLLDGGTDAPSSTHDAAPSFCESIPPSNDPAQNHAAIMGCLQNEGVARLAPGDFPIVSKIVMPDGSRLLGDASRPHIWLTTGQQALVELHDDNELASLRLDANHMLTVPHGAIVYFVGKNSSAHHNTVHNADGPRGENKVTGVRFWFTENGGESGNRASENAIYDVHYGVIFDKHPHGTDNLLESNEIYDIRCDGVSFRGYGRAHGNVLYRLGRQCLNPPDNPIPGGGFYTLDNDDGAEIVDNHVYETCGMPLDLDRSARLDIRNNVFEKPGFSAAPGYEACGAGSTAHLIDIRDSAIIGNTFRNSGQVIGSDPNRVLSASGSGEPDDLPAGANTAVAFMLTHRRDATTYTTTHNTIEDNRFIANCTAPCYGLGFFAGRGTGYDLAGNWSATTTNYFRRNNPFGSNIGSKRCGGNWYAADSTCEEGNLDPDCNIDDPQHTGAGYDFARNDGCNHYP